jgi:hypothetical protein
MIGQSGARSTAAIALEALDAFGRLRLRLTGTSMLPTLRPGDIVDFSSFHASQAKPGDIVLFRRESGLVTHRVVTCNTDALITQGDSLDAPDLAVAHADVLARAVGLTRGNRLLDWNRASRSPRLVTRWWFRRFDMATRMWLRWHRRASRRAA